MTDEEVQEAYKVLSEELVDYFRTELPEKVGTTDAVDAKAEEILAAIDAQAEAAEAETAEATTVAE